MNSLKIRDIILGEGTPKICVPITGHTEEEIRLRTQELLTSRPDLAEWRADWYAQAKDPESLLHMLSVLRELLGEMPLLVTFRTKEEGGEQTITRTEYREFLFCVMASGKADLVDVELFQGEDLLREACGAAHRLGVSVVASNHDFERTPAKEELVRRLCMMQDLGADVLKLAVMPRSPEDVLTLLSATWQMRSEFARQPLITMAMGGLGVMSRLAGEVFGSSVTFGSAGVASAPGQLEVDELKGLLHTLHGAL